MLMLLLGVGDGIAWQGTFRGPRQTGDGYNAGAKRKSTHEWMLLLGVGDGIASHFFVGLLEDVLATRIELAFDTLDDVVAAIGFHVTF